MYHILEMSRVCGRCGENQYPNEFFYWMNMKIYVKVDRAARALVGRLDDRCVGPTWRLGQNQRANPKR